MSYATYIDIPDGSAATPGLWNSRFSAIAGSIGASGLSTSRATITNLSGVSTSVVTIGSGKLTWNGSQFLTTGGGMFINGTTNIVSGYVSTFFALTSPTAPTSGDSTGEQGQIAWSANTFYVCVSTNSWRRVALSAF